jgi:hypothetical protein
MVGLRKNLCRVSTHCLLSLAAALFFMTACNQAPSIEPVEGTVSALSTLSVQQAAAISAQATIIASQAEHISYLATRGPFMATPIPPGAEPTPYYPVVGSVIIEGGRCCVGARAGEEIELAVEFDALSQFGEVTDMRMRLANIRFSEEDLLATEWEPFVITTSLPVSVSLNWVTYYLTVQYRDEAGNLSPVYSAEIAVEGSP